jgi:hypothetical protein
MRLSILLREKYRYISLYLDPADLAHLDGCRRLVPNGNLDQGLTLTPYSGQGGVVIGIGNTRTRGKRLFYRTAISRHFIGTKCPPGRTTHDVPVPVAYEGSGKIYIPPVDWSLFDFTTEPPHTRRSRDQDDPRQPAPVADPKPTIGHSDLQILAACIRTVNDMMPSFPDAVLSIDAYSGKLKLMLELS